MKLLSVYSSLFLLIGTIGVEKAHFQKEDYIYYASGVNSRGRDIVRIDVNGGSKVKLTSYTGNGHYPHYNGPKVSPDGKKIAYHADTDRHDKYAIWVMDIDGSNAKRLTQKEGLYASWSSDSQQIIFSGRRQGVWEILTIPSSGGIESNISENFKKAKKSGWGAVSSFHPDGKSIIYAYIRENKLYVMDLETKNTRQLGLQGENFSHPIFSKDGLRIAVNRKQKDAYDLITMSPDGSDIKVIVENVISYATPSWSRSGEEILFTGMVDGNQEIFKINLNTNKETRLTKNKGFDAMATW